MVQSSFKIPECINTKVKLKQLVLAEKEYGERFHSEEKETEQDGSRVYVVYTTHSQPPATTTQCGISRGPGRLQTCYSVKMNFCSSDPLLPITEIRGVHHHI